MEVIGPALALSAAFAIGFVVGFRAGLRLLIMTIVRRRFFWIKDERWSFQPTGIKRDHKEG